MSDDKDSSQTNLRDNFWRFGSKVALRRKPRNSAFTGDKLYTAYGKDWRSEVGWMQDIPTFGDEGSVYVVELDNGMLKVGRSATPIKRVSAIISEEGRYTLPVAVGISLPHKQWLKNEALLIEYCANQFETYRGRERFLVDGIHDVFEFADELKKTRSGFVDGNLSPEEKGDIGLLQEVTRQLRMQNEIMTRELAFYKKRTSQIVHKCIADQNFVRLLSVADRAKKTSEEAFSALMQALPAMPSKPVAGESYFYDKPKHAFLRANWVDGETKWHIPVTTYYGGAAYNQHFEFKPSCETEKRCPRCSQPWPKKGPR